MHMPQNEVVCQTRSWWNLLVPDNRTIITVAPWMNFLLFSYLVVLQYTVAENIKLTQETLSSAQHPTNDVLAAKKQLNCSGWLLKDKVSRVNLVCLDRDGAIASVYAERHSILCSSSPTSLSAICDANHSASGLLYCLSKTLTRDMQYRVKLAAWSTTAHCVWILYFAK